MKLGIVVHCPSPHQKVMLDCLYDAHDTDVVVAYAYPDSPNRNWGNPVADGRIAYVPPVFRLSGGRKLRSWVSDLDRDVWALCAGYTFPRTQALASVFHHQGIPWAYVGEPPRPRTGLPAFVRDFLLYRVLDRCHGVIATGKEPARRYRRLLRDDRPVTSVPYYIPLDEWLSLPSISTPQPNQRIRFLTLARLIHRKGLDLLVAACEQLRPGGWQVDVYGDGPERATLQRMIRNRRLPIALHAPLAFADRTTAFEGAHCFVFPSRWDGWGMAPVEALAAGLPVIATDQTMSMYDFLENDRNGWMVPCDSSAIATAMQRVIDHPEHLPELSRTARQSVMGYDPAAGAKELIGFCRNLFMAHQSCGKRHLP